MLKKKVIIKHWIHFLFCGWLSLAWFQVIIILKVVACNLSATYPWAKVSSLVFCFWYITFFLKYIALLFDSLYNSISKSRIKYCQLFLIVWEDFLVAFVPLPLLFRTQNLGLHHLFFRWLTLSAHSSQNTPSNLILSTRTVTHFKSSIFYFF